MRVVSPKVLREFGEKHPDAGRALEHWTALVKAGNWESSADVKRTFGGSVDFVPNNRAIFDIKGNDYRMIVEINFRRRAVFVRFLGTHSEYDRVDAATVKMY
jgi:mRNA interferase HigB